MEKYINEIPLLVRNSIKALCDENRQGVLIYLLKKGPKSFIEISKDLKIPKNNLSHHIKILMRYALIYNFYDRNEYDDKYSFYEISKLGTRIITALLNLVSPIIFQEDREPLIEITEPTVSAEKTAYVLGNISSAKVGFFETEAQKLQIVTTGIVTVPTETGYEWSSRKMERFPMNTAE